MILDSNGLIYCLKNGKTLPNEELLVTDDLRDEYETALLVNGHRSLAMVDARSLPRFDDAFFYKEYAKYLNSFPGVNVASMRSLTDVSILALVSCIVNQFGQVQQIRLNFGEENKEQITIITDDGGLTRQLKSDFNDHIEIIAPSSL